MGYNVIYIIHCYVFTQSMVVKEFVIFEISLKKKCISSRDWKQTNGKKLNELKESIFSTVHLPPVHIHRKSLNL